MGIGHELSTSQHSGRNETLTDASLTNAQVVSKLLTKPPRIESAAETI